jgi:UDP-N-acetylglucosamine--N-acetylmuramyl-(pentapeptide) pyrophosphoryl-undecaprenol N-acetylglucosamine transferase
MIRALRIARNLIRDRRPAAVIGLGGFASGPVVWAASRQGIPVILLEQNVIPGRATRWLSRWAKTICLSFDETIERLAPRYRSRCRVTGNPVRQEIAAMAGEPKPAGDTVARQPTLLVLGGSLGSRSLNALMTAFASESSKALSGWRIVHQAGDEADVVRGRYPATGLDVEVRPFLEDMPAQLRQADLVVGRAGATTLAEIACAGLPAVLVPFPQAADDHQRANAEAYVRGGGALMVLERGETSQTLAEFRAAVLPLLEETDRRTAASRAMRSLARPHAAIQVADLLEQTARPSIEV